MEVCEAAEAAYRRGEAPLNAVEGFVRQMIGWREYIRGMYWLEMPGLSEANFFENNRPLPDFYWTGDTRMACCADSVRNTRDNAYAHHIQRLMVLGNFAMLAGIEPAQVADWYLVVYADAYEWVEHPNVLGMSQYADGGRLGTKPYAGSGAYINKMSNYCSGCHYNVKKRVGEDACPFNALYWDFLARNEKKLRGNRRLWQTYSTWDRFGDASKAEIRLQAQRFLASLEAAAPGWARGEGPPSYSAAITEGASGVDKARSD
jgi:deoxyribodipyrimidine photolyase-related protein